MRQECRFHQVIVRQCADSLPKLSLLGLDDIDQFDVWRGNFSIVFVKVFSMLLWVLLLLAYISPSTTFLYVTAL